MRYEKDSYDREFIRVSGDEETVDEIESWGNEYPSENGVKYNLLKWLLNVAPLEDGVSIELEKPITVNGADNVADIVIDDHIAIEAKGENGDVRKAVGQAMSYKIGGYDSYIAIPCGLNEAIKTECAEELCTYASVGMFFTGAATSSSVKKCLLSDPQDESWVSDLAINGDKINSINVPKREHTENGRRIYIEEKESNIF